MQDVLYFTVYAFAGWLLESLVSTAARRRPVNRGFLHGCFCPIYGFGALCAVLSFRISAWCAQGVPGFAGRFLTDALGALLSTLFAVGLELTAGALLKRLFDCRLWDYRKRFANFRGYICLPYALLWGVLACAAAKLLHPLLTRFPAPLPRAARDALGAVFLVYFLADFLFTSLSLLLRRYRAEEASLRRDYEACVRDLLESPRVRTMDGFTQHGTVSCLTHCRHVSYLSYAACRLFGLDARAAARGGLLHDYFLYDWHTSAPCRWHGFRHPGLALKNARHDFVLTAVEEEVIARHMWPLTITPPQHAAALAVSMADKICTAAEVLEDRAGARRYRALRKRIGSVLEK